MRTQQRREHASLAGQAAGVAADRAPRPVAAPDLEDDDGLATVGRAIERGHESLRLPHRLEEHRDHACRRVVDEVLEEVDGRDDRFVPGRDHLAPAEAPAIRQQADADRPALRNQPHVAGEPSWIVHRLDVDEARHVRADHPHAVRPAQRHRCLATDRRDRILPRAALRVRFREPAVKDDGRADAAIGRRLHVLEHAGVVHAERQHVDVARQVGHGRVAAAAEDALVPRIDRIDIAAKTDAVERFDDGAADRRSLRGADDRDRAGTQQPIKRHGCSFYAGTSRSARRGRRRSPAASTRRR